MGKTVKFPDVFVGDYHPLEFLTLVREEVGDERPPMVSSIILLLDSKGKLTIHTSSTDRERNHLLMSLAARHCLNEAGEALAYGFMRDDEEGGPEPAA